MKILTSELDSVPATTSSWKESLRRAIRSIDDLCERLALSRQDLDSLRVRDDFPLFVTEEFLSRIEPGNPADPLLRQVLPLAIEDEPTPEAKRDAVGDSVASRSPGLIQKYAGRALLIVSGACGIHCRYCFRRHFPYEQAMVQESYLEEALHSLASDDSISEVILSGGDPLMWVDQPFFRLVDRLAEIPHLETLRIHSRMPIVVPQRTDQAWGRRLMEQRLQVVLVIHANHANELDGSVQERLATLGAEGILLLNQAVLLRGVNDSVSALESLSRRLIACQVMPYYLHQLDQVQGAMHFNVPVSEGRRLIQDLRKRLPGYAVPRYVAEIAGEPHKTLLSE